MVHDDYMLILGSNVYADPVYNLVYKLDMDSEESVPLFTLENCDGSLLRQLRSGMRIPKS